MSVSIDAVALKRRVGTLQKALPELGVDSIATMLGRGEQETQGVVNSVLHVWLLGYPFANTGIILTSAKLTIITSAKQAKMLEEFADDALEVVVRPKAAEDSVELFATHLKTLSGTVGVFSDTPESPVANVWTEQFKAAVSDTKDISTPFLESLHIKEPTELEAIAMASKASKSIMMQVFVDQMTSIIDEGRKVPHTVLAKKVDDVIDNDKALRKLKLGPSFESTYIDWSHPIIIKSGQFDFKGPTTADNLKAGVIYCELGLKYKFYNSTVGRTYMIDATKDQEDNYSTLLGLQKVVIAAIKAGASCESVYDQGRNYLQETDASLLPYLSASFGHSVGIPQTETGLDLTAGNKSTLTENETLIVRVSFENIKGESGSYSLGLVDTVQVTGDEALVFTDSPRSKSDIAFSLQSEEKPTTRPSRQLRVDPREKSNQLLASHQAELKKQLQERGLAKYSGTDQIDTEEALQFKKYESYKREQQLPQLKDLRIALDSAAQTIIVPVNGRPVPFHINTYKNGSKTEENDYVYLRLNFNSPDTALGKNEMPFENPNATFVKSLTIRSKNIDRVNDVFKKITDMKRDSVRKEVERRQLKDVVQQDKLVEVKDRRPLRLDPVYVRPMPEGKRVPGFLEIHKNGVRYQSPQGRDQKVEVLFSNVDKIFFQPSVSELVVLIHFHLKAPIMIGKRKTIDVQFYRDATDFAYDDTGNRKRRYRYGDEDEIEQEQEERRIRKALDKEFKLFAEQIAKASEKLEVDIPFRELGFYGVPFRTNVYIQPTTDCLVQLVDTPFLVIKLDEIEVAHLERIQFGLKEFDLVFVFKDYTKAPAHINTIPISQLDAVKDWLNEMDIAFYEGPLNLNWSVIMKTIASAPSDFYQNDGWEFLSLEDDNEEVVEEDSEFEDDGDAALSESEFDDEEEDFSAESEIQTEDEDSGPEWDELEAEAAREDELAERDSGDERPRARGRKSKGRR